MRLDEKADRIVHRVAPGLSHGFAAPIVAHAFEVLRISATLWEHGVFWMPIHTHPTLESFEQQHGMDHHRRKYNGRMLARVLAEKRAVRGEHAGLCDLFAPVVIGGEVAAILVCGPFARERPGVDELLGRWRWLTGNRAHPADPEFAAYLAARLDVLVLEGTRLEAFERLVECFTKLMEGTGDVGAILNRAEALRAEVQGARFVDEMWESARTMVDDRNTRRWQGVSFEKSRRLLGLSQTAEDVLVALLVTETKELDPLDHALSRDAFQRASAYLARDLGDLIAGRVGNHGVVFLSSRNGSARKRKQRLLDLARRASALAHESCRLSLSFGLHLASPSVPVSRTYQVALAAAENALRQGEWLVVGEPGTRRAAESLRELRADLAKTAELRPERLEARFDRYVELLTLQSGDRIEFAQGQLDAAFERIAEPFIKGGAIDAKSVRELGEELERVAAETNALDELCAAYRRAITALREARSNPGPARHDRSLRAALELIHHHYAEALSLDQVARTSGYHPDHFSKLFKQQQSATFEDYLRRFRLEQAARLLADTDLGLSRVAELTGFHSSQYFCRAFRQHTGMTPTEHRQRLRSKKTRRKPPTQTA